LKEQGYRLSDFAVLMRINALTRSYEQEFTKYGIPYKVFGGFKFFERKEIKDILAYLRITANPGDDEALMRIINVPRRGIGDKTLETLLNYAAKEDISLYYAILDADELPLNGGAKEKLRAFGGYIKELVLRAQEERVDILTQHIIKTSGMYEQYADLSDESVTKRANIDEFQNSVDEFVRMNPDSTLSDYLQQITLYSDTDEMDDGEYVTVATIHAVKGLEFKGVFLVGLEEDVIPTKRANDSPAALEEERRLMYVAITRARELLWLTRSKSRYLYGHREFTVRSKFVDELKDQLSIPESRVYPRYSGDYNYGRSYSGGYSGGYSSGYSGGGYGYGNSAPRRVGSVKREEDEGFRTFGTGKPQVRKEVFAPPKAEAKDVSRFAVGVKVRHTRFGDGEIVAMRGAESNLIITVKFETAGNKDLAAALAPLEVLD
ncbi:MAG: ATP-binding domain-containing protein, partial [Clostridia bacterium]|nr:ATP-binding domain-containing protein [Clostridia bacterium]